MTSPQDAAPEPTSETFFEPTFQPVAAIAPTAPIPTYDPLSFRSRERHRAGLAAALGATTLAAAGFAALIMLAPPRPAIPDRIETAAVERETEPTAIATQPNPAPVGLSASGDIRSGQTAEPGATAMMAPTLTGEGPHWAQLLAPVEANAVALAGNPETAETLAGNPPRRMTAPDLPELDTWEAENHSAEPSTDEIDPGVTAAIGDPAYERTARATRYVNLRAEPADEGEVLTVVPANGELVVVGCERWCEVEYDGKRGFIYKRFVR